MTEIEKFVYKCSYVRCSECKKGKVDTPDDTLFCRECKTNKYMIYGWHFGGLNYACTKCGFKNTRFAYEF